MGDDRLSSGSRQRGERAGVARTHWGTGAYRRDEGQPIPWLETTLSGRPAEAERWMQRARGGGRDALPRMGWDGWKGRPCSTTWRLIIWLIASSWSQPFAALLFLFCLRRITPTPIFWKCDACTARGWRLESLCLRLSTRSASHSPPPLLEQGHDSA